MLTKYIIGALICISVEISKNFFFSLLVVCLPFFFFIGLRIRIIGTHTHSTGTRTHSYTHPHTHPERTSVTGWIPRWIQWSELSQQETGARNQAPPPALLREVGQCPDPQAVLRRFSRRLSEMGQSRENWCLSRHWYRAWRLYPLYHNASPLRCHFKNWVVFLVGV